MGTAPYVSHMSTAPYATGLMLLAETTLDDKLNNWGRTVTIATL